MMNAEQTQVKWEDRMLEYVRERKVRELEDAKREVRTRINEGSSAMCISWG